MMAEKTAMKTASASRIQEMGHSVRLPKLKLAVTAHRLPVLEVSISHLHRQIYHIFQAHILARGTQRQPRHQTVRDYHRLTSHPVVEDSTQQASGVFQWAEVPHQRRRQASIPWLAPAIGET